MWKNFILSEALVDNIINQNLKKMINENYHLDSAEDIMEYMWLRPRVTNLNVDIFVDDSGAYIRQDRDLVLYARNGYDKSVSDFIPFLISSNPIVLDGQLHLPKGRCLSKG